MKVDEEILKEIKEKGLDNFVFDLARRMDLLETEIKLIKNYFEVKLKEKNETNRAN